MAAAKKYTDEELKQLRRIQMDIYREIKRICTHHNIPFVAIGGTAIGAVRHNGYIPWDDDLDVAMMRKDYNRFLKHAKKELNPKFFLQNIYTDPDYGNYFTKIRCNGTLFVQPIDKNDKSHHGIFVDVFPLDRLTDDPGERAKYKRKLMILFQLFMAKSSSGISGETDSLKGKLKHCIRTFLHILLTFTSKKKLFLRVNKLCQKYNKTGSNTIMVSVLYAMTGRCIEESAIFPAVEHSFENETILIPHNTDRYLSHIYGKDYMELPPVEKRVNHRPIILSFGKEE